MVVGLDTALCVARCHRPGGRCGDDLTPSLFPYSQLHPDPCSVALVGQREAPYRSYSEGAHAFDARAVVAVALEGALPADKHVPTARQSRKRVS
jgi:hypothetical protein